MADKVIFAEQTVTSEYAPSYALVASALLVEGTTYRVVIDGEETECVAYSYNGVVVIGNEFLTGQGNDTGEDFLLMSGEIEGSFILEGVINLDGNTHTIAIYEVAAEDKQYLIYESTLTGIADAIRGKTESADPIKVSDMATEIEGISGKPAVIEPLSVTENGTYNPAEGTDGFGTVTVNVPTPAPVIEPLNVTENGTYTPSAGVDGFSPVTVNVQASGGDDWYITDASYLFYNGARLDGIHDLLPRLKDLTNMRYMFYNCDQLTELDVSGWDTSNVTDMSYAFDHCRKVRAIDVSGWDTSNVTNMQNAFGYCNSITSLDVSNFDTSKVTSMSYMFNSCINVTELNVSGFDTSNVTSMSGMFGDLGKVTTLNLSNWDTGKVTSMTRMFQGSYGLSEIIGFSATNKAGLTIAFPMGSASIRYALKRLTFRTDLPDGVYSIRSAIDIKYCSFDRDGMVEMFNTLPDVSGLGLSSSYTTITITGNPCVTDGTLTAEDEAIATAKGWTLVK